MDPSFLLIHIVNSTFHQPQLDLRQRLVSNACKSLVFHMWQAGLL